MRRDLCPDISPETAVNEESALFDVGPSGQQPGSKPYERIVADPPVEPRRDGQRSASHVTGVCDLIAKEDCVARPVTALAADSFDLAGSFEARIFDHT